MEEWRRSLLYLMSKAAAVRANHERIELYRARRQPPPELIAKIDMPKKWETNRGAENG